CAQHEIIPGLALQPGNTIEDHKRIVDCHLQPSVFVALESQLVLSIDLAIHKRRNFGELFRLTAEVFERVDHDFAIRHAGNPRFPHYAAGFEDISLQTPADDIEA